MRSYLTVFSNTIQKAFLYRAHILVSAFANTFSPIILLIIWTSYYQTGHSVGNYSFAQLSNYYLATILVSLVASRVQGAVTSDIKDGELTNYVIKPFNYFFYRLSWEAAWHLVKFSVFIIPLFAISAILKLPLAITTDPLKLFLAFLSLIFSYLLTFSLSITIGTVAFYILETTGITNLFEQITAIFTGKYFPLTFFPLTFQNFIGFTPLKYTIYFPAQSLIGLNTIPQLILGLASQIFWIIVVSSIYFFSWHRGISKFSAVGL